MKICPRCSKTYADDNLNFCLEDGSVLTQMAQAQQTQRTPEARQTHQPQPPVLQPPPQWNTPAYSAQQPQRKSSKTWVWVLLILGAIALLCGGGFLGLMVFIGSQAEQAANTSVSNSANTPTNTAAIAWNSNSVSDATARKNVENITFSKWVPESPKFAEVEYTDGELLVKNKEKSYYYVLAGTEKQRSVDADSAVTVRNVDNADTNLGYGLVFHSQTIPLQQGYAFVIDAKKKRYRVVHHTPNDEDAVIDWTRSPEIKDGTQLNVLEARDRSGNVDLYINGKKVNSIKNVYGFSAGVVGIYSSGGLKVAFRDLQIRR